MIDPRELSVGNYVYDRGGKILRIDWWESINKVCMYMKIEGSKVHPLTEYVEYCEPIPLTEQWLIDFGAIKKYGSYSEYYLHKMKFDFSTEGICRFHWSSKVTYLDYVHELQNLVKSLTGKELTKQ